MIEIRVSSDPKFLTIVRAMVGQVCEVVGVPEEEQHKIILAVDEACANIMKHTFQGDHTQSIVIRCATEGDRLEFVLTDCGPPIDPEKIKPRDLDELRPGGLGTHFIRTIMDEVEYEYKKECGNVLRMVKYFHADDSNQEN